jgi:hypothetical protein
VSLDEFTECRRDAVEGPETARRWPRRRDQDGGFGRDSYVSSASAILRTVTRRRLYRQADVARILGVSDERVRQLRRRPDFREPVDRWAGGRSLGGRGRSTLGSDLRRRRSALRVSCLAPVGGSAATAAGRTARALLEEELLDVVVSRDHPPTVRLMANAEAFD